MVSHRWICSESAVSVTPSGCLRQQAKAVSAHSLGTCLGCVTEALAENRSAMLPCSSTGKHGLENEAEYSLLLSSQESSVGTLGAIKAKLLSADPCSPCIPEHRPAGFTSCWHWKVLGEKEAFLVAITSAGRLFVPHMSNLNSQQW